MLRRTLRSGRVSRVVTALIALLAVSPAPPAAAAVTCGTPSVPMYHVDALGQLRRWSYSAPLTGGSGWSVQVIGSSWSGLNVISGGDGVLYALDSTGNLRWYQDGNFNGSDGQAWNSASGSVIGTGWGGFTTVIADTNGVIYAVDASGNMHWYRYIGTNGSSAWAPGSGNVIGSGWNAPAQIVAGGSGIIYAVGSTGALTWYRYLDLTGGTVSWADSGIGQQIGSGWSFSRIGSVGGGVIFARTLTGSMQWYRDTDPLGGSASWANQGLGISQGVGWNGNQIIGDVAGCVAS